MRPPDEGNEETATERCRASPADGAKDVRVAAKIPRAPPAHKQPRSRSPRHKQLRFERRVAPGNDLGESQGIPKAAKAMAAASLGHEARDKTRDGAQESLETLAIDKAQQQMQVRADIGDAMKGHVVRTGRFFDACLDLQTVCDCQEAQSPARFVRAQDQVQGFACSALPSISEIRARAICDDTINLVECAGVGVGVAFGGAGVQ